MEKIVLISLTHIRKINFFNSSYNYLLNLSLIRAPHSKGENNAYATEKTLKSFIQKTNKRLENCQNVISIKDTGPVV